MAVTRFPAPGCANGTQFLSPFSGFDVAPVSGGTFTNLLTYSQNQQDRSWFRGDGTLATTDKNGVTTVTIADTLYNIVNWFVDVGTNDYILETTPTVGQLLGKAVAVQPNTTYTFSFYAKKGTATVTTSGIYDNTNASDIVPATSYTNQLNTATWTRVTTTFTTSSNTTSISIFPAWTNSTAGTTFMFGMQLEVGSIANNYQLTTAFTYAGYVAPATGSYSYASKIKDAYVVKGIATTLQEFSPGNVAKKGQELKSLLTALTTFSTGYIAKKGQEFKSVPYNVQISLLTKQLTIVKSDSILRPLGKLTSAIVVKAVPGSDTKFDVNSLLKPFEIVKSDNNSKLIVISPNPYKITGTQVFTPDSANKVTASITVKAIPGGDTKFDVNLLSKQLEKIKGIPGGDTKFDVSKLTSVVKTVNPTPNDVIVFDPGLARFKTTSDKTQVFAPYTVYKLNTVTTAKGINNIIQVGKANTVSNAKGVANNIKQENLANISSAFWNYNNQANLGQAGPTYANTFTVTNTFVAPYANAYFSYFSGSNTVYSSTLNCVATGNFTIEGQFYFTGSTQNTIFSIGNESANRVVFFHNGADNTLNYNTFGAGSVALTSTTVPKNTWTHIAIVRNGTSVTTYVNAVAGAPITLAGSIGNANGFQVMGTNGGPAGQGTGFVSNFRYVNGTAIAPLVVPTANLTSVTNTQLLLFQTADPAYNGSANKNIVINYNGVVAGSIASGYTALQFNPTYSSVTAYFQPSDVIKLTDATTSYTSLIQTNGATNFSSSFAYLQVPTSTLSLFAASTGSNWSFQQWSPSVYTQAQVYTANVKNSYTPQNLNTGSPGYNLFLSYGLSFNKYGIPFTGPGPNSRNLGITSNVSNTGELVSVATAKGLANNIITGKAASVTKAKGLANNITVSKMAQFSVDTIPLAAQGDFSLLVTGQTATVSYSAVEWYLELTPSSNLLTSTPIAPTGITTYYFAAQPIVRFDVGTTVRITNKAYPYLGIGYLQYVTVIASTRNSISFTTPATPLPVIGTNTYISGGATLISQDTVSYTRYPVTPRDNLASFNYLPSLRAKPLVTKGTAMAESVYLDTDGLLNKQLEVIKSDSLTIKSGKIDKFFVPNTAAVDSEFDLFGAGINKKGQELRSLPQYYQPYRLSDVDSSLWFYSNGKTSVVNAGQSYIGVQGSALFYGASTSVSGNNTLLSFGGPVGQAVFTTSGTWTAPTGVTSVSVVAVGSGGTGGNVTNGGGGGGGALAYANNITVVPGQAYTVTIGSVGNATWFKDISTVAAGSGSSSTTTAGASGGLVLAGTGFGGGAGGSFTGTGGPYGAGGGGAGGYAGVGGTGGYSSGSTTPPNPTAGAGGGGGGGGGSYSPTNIGSGLGGGGGGVGLLGLGASGAAGVNSNQGTGSPGGGGSGGSAGNVRDGGTYGGGAGGGTANIAGPGAVRIMWGTGRSYPSTNTADQASVAASFKYPMGTWLKISDAVGNSVLVKPVASVVGTVTVPTDSLASLSGAVTTWMIDTWDLSVYTQEQVRIANQTYPSNSSTSAFINLYMASGAASINPWGIDYRTESMEPIFDSYFNALGIIPKLKTDAINPNPVDAATFDAAQLSKPITVVRNPEGIFIKANVLAKTLGALTKINPVTAVNPNPNDAIVFDAGKLKVTRVYKEPSDQRKDLTLLSNYPSALWNKNNKVNMGSYDPASQGAGATTSNLFTINSTSVSGNQTFLYYTPSWGSPNTLIRKTDTVRLYDATSTAEYLTTVNAVNTTNNYISVDTAALSNFSSIVYTNYGIQLSGTSSSLVIPAASSPTFGSNTAWTIELFAILNQQTVNTVSTIIQRATASASAVTGDWTLNAKYVTIGYVTLSFYATDYSTTTAAVSATVKATGWNHVAIVRNGSTVTMYINGAAASSVTAWNFGSNSTAQTTIGANVGNTGGANYGSGWPGSSSNLSGWISSVRVLNNKAAYTGAFVVPARPLNTSQLAGTNISAILASDTVLLLARSSTIIDNSLTNATITASNATVINVGNAVTTTSPATAYPTIASTDVVFSVNFDQSTTSTLTDQGPNNYAWHTVSTNPATSNTTLNAGGPTINSVNYLKFIGNDYGPGGYPGFSKTGFSKTVRDNIFVGFKSWSFEVGFRITATGTVPNSTTLWGDYGGFRIWIEQATGPVWKIGLLRSDSALVSGWYDYVTLSSAPTVNTWYHLVVTYTGTSSTAGTIRAFINGSLSGTTNIDKTTGGGIGFDYYSTNTESYDGFLYYTGVTAANLAIDIDSAKLYKSNPFPNTGFSTPSDWIGNSAITTYGNDLGSALSGGSSSWSFQQWSPAVFTQSQVNNYVGTTLPRNFIEPYINLWYMLYAPINTRGVRPYYQVVDIANTLTTIAKLGRNEPNQLLAPDIVVPLTGVSDNSNWNAISSYLDIAPVDLVTSTPTTSNTTKLYYSKQFKVPFQVGDRIAVTNLYPSFTTYFGTKQLIATSGNAEFVTPGTYTWTAPAGVTSVSALAIGAGGGGGPASSGGGGGGGGLGYRNNIPVVPGQTYTVVVGAGGAAFGAGATGAGRGGDSYFMNTSQVVGGGGNGGVTVTGGTGGGWAGEAGGNGGTGGNGGGDVGGGGGGAGGYTGNGGSGGSNGGQPSSGAGGGGGGGGTSTSTFGNGNGTPSGAGGGGVGIYGQGANGAAGVSNPYNVIATGGSGGSGGASGTNNTINFTGGNAGGPGGGFGGGAGGCGGSGNGGSYVQSTTYNVGAGGAVRIIWGSGRTFPSATTAFNMAADQNTYVQPQEDMNQLVSTAASALWVTATVVAVDSNSITVDVPSSTKIIPSASTVIVSGATVFQHISTSGLFKDSIPRNSSTTPIFNFWSTKLATPVNKFGINYTSYTKNTAIPIDDTLVGRLIVATEKLPVKSVTPAINTDRLETLYTQSSVVVTGKPASPRENLYYFYLAPGLRGTQYQKSVSEALDVRLQGNLAETKKLRTIYIDSQGNLAETKKLKTLYIDSAGQLTKQIEKIKGIPGGDTKFDVSKLLSVTKVTNPTPLDYLLFDVANLPKPFENVRGDGTDLSSATLLKPVKFSNTQVMFTPELAKLSQGLKVSAIVTQLDKGQLTKAFEVIKGTPVTLTVNKVSATIRPINPTPLDYLLFDVANLPKPFENVRGDNNILKTDKLQPSKFSNNQMFEIPSIFTTKIPFVIKAVPGSDTKFDVNTLSKQIEVVKSLAALSTQGTVKDNYVVRSDSNTLTIAQAPNLKASAGFNVFTPTVDKVSAATKVIGLTSKINVASLPKPFEVVKAIPGSDTKFDVNKLSRFEPISSGSSAPDFGEQITGVNFVQVSNVLDWYLEYLPGSDVFTSSITTPLSTSTIYFSRPVRTGFLVVGDIVSIIHSADVTVDALGNVTSVNYTSPRYSIITAPVAELTPSSVTINVAQANLPQPITQYYIVSGATVYTQSGVRTTTAPATPRDNLYYATIAPAHFGITLNNYVGANSVSDANALYGNLQKAFEIVKDLTSIVSMGALPKPFEVVKSDQIVLKTDTLRNVSVLRDLPLQPAFQLTGRVEKQKLPATGEAKWGREKSDPDAYYWNSITLANALQGNLSKQLMPLKGDTIIFKTDLVKDNYVVNAIPGGDTKFDVNTITKQVEVIKSLTSINNITIGKVVSTASLESVLNEKQSLSVTFVLPVKFGNNQVFLTPNADNLQKPFEQVKGTVSVLEVNNVKDSYVVKGDTQQLLASQLPNLKFANTEVFDSPTVSKLINIDVLKGFKNEDIFLDSNFLAKQLEVIRAEPSSLTPGPITKLKYNNNEVFYGPLASLLKDSFVVEEISAKFITELLTKQVESIKGTITNLNTDKLVSVTVAKGIKGEESNFDVYNLVKPFEIVKGDLTNLTPSNLQPLKSTNTQVFQAPAMSVLKDSFVVKASDITLTASPIDKFKYQNNGVTYAPLTISALNASWVIRGTAGKFLTESITKQIEKIRGSLDNVKIGNMVNIAKIKATDTATLTSGMLPPVKFGNNQVFRNPELSAVKDSFVVKGDKQLLLTELLTQQIEVIKGERIKLTTDSLPKAFEVIKGADRDLSTSMLPPVKFGNNQVFLNPELSTLKSSFVVKGDKFKFTTDSVKAVSKLTEVKQVINAAFLVKQLHSLKDLTNNIKIGSLQKPVNILRGGYNVEPEYRLETYDNMGVFESDPIIITNVSNVFYDVVSYYVWDQDTLEKITLTDTLVQTLTFTDPNPYTAQAFVPGSYIQLVDSGNGNVYSARILAATRTTVTIETIQGFPSTTMLGTIQGASPSVFPMTYYLARPLPAAPSNPRENLAYFNIAPALRADRQQQLSTQRWKWDQPLIDELPNAYGKLSAAEKVKGVTSLSRLGKLVSVSKYKEAVSSLIFQVQALKSPTPPASTVEVFSITDKIGHIDLRELLREAVVPNGLKVDVLAFIPKRLHEELAYQVFFLPTNLGKLTKFRTGDFKNGSIGIQDVSFTKPAPIQFWS